MIGLLSEFRIRNDRTSGRNLSNHRGSQVNITPKLMKTPGNRDNTTKPMILVVIKDYESAFDAVTLIQIP